MSKKAVVFNITRVIGIIILFIGMIFIPSISCNPINKSSIFTLNGNTLYVGGIGGGNYTGIQDAINDALDGDTVFVYDESSPYNENVVVNKSIKLIGENKNTTIIKGNEINCTMGLFADGINVQEFTLQHSKEIKEEYMEILYVYSNNNNITNIIFFCKPFRLETVITLKNSSKNLISQNIIKNNYYTGIELRNSHFNEISRNIIIGLIWRRGVGIQLIDSSNNIIKRNEFRINSCCVNLNELHNLTINNQIIQNNFMIYYFRMSGIYFEYDYHLFKENRGNIIDENYWNRPRIIPKYVLGWLNLFWIPTGRYRYLFSIILPKFDMHPAKKPYDIQI
jgi:parallel beta-helix repeat protein